MQLAVMATASLGANGKRVRRQLLQLGPKLSLPLGLRYSLSLATLLIDLCLLGKDSLG